MPPDWYGHLRPEVRAEVAVEVWRAQAAGLADVAWERGAAVAEAAHAELWRSHAVSGRARVWSTRYALARWAAEAYVDGLGAAVDEWVLDAVADDLLDHLLGRDDW